MQSIFATVKKIRRWLVRLFLAIIALVALLLVFISPVCEWLVEKYSEEYLGRKVKMEDLSINLLMGTIYIENLQIHEQKSEQVWLSCTEIKAGIHSGKLISGSYVVPSVLVNGLKTTVVQNGDHFNFDDLLALPDRYASPVKEVEPTTESTIWTIFNIALKNSELRYVSPAYGIDYTASDIQISIPEIAWNRSNMHFDYAFDISTGGSLSGSYAIDIADLQYSLHLISSHIQIDAVKPYLEDFIALNEFTGSVDTDLHLQGNHAHPENLEIAGDFRIRNLVCLDTLNEKLASIEQFSIGIDSIDVQSNYFDFGDIELDRPQLTFEMYTQGDNWSRMMFVSESSGESLDSTSSYSNPFILLANYIRTYIKDYVVSDYYADHIIMRGGAISFVDFTLDEPFRCDLDSMTLAIDRLNTDMDRLKMTFATLINDEGRFETSIAINPRDYQDMECSFELKQVPSIMFNPYMTYYVATPFTAGKISFDNKTSILAGMLAAQNALFVEQPKTGAKVKNQTAMKLPVKLAVSLLKNVDGNIDIAIPVEGNLNDPEYKLRKAIWSIVKNLLLKAAQAPGNLLAKLSGDKEENLQEILISYGMHGFTRDQEIAIQKMAKPLLLKPELNLLLTQCTNHEAELDALISLDARRQFAEERGIIVTQTETPEMVYSKLEGISIQDSVFTGWLIEKLGPTNSMVSTLDLCKKITNKAALENVLLEMHQSRDKNLLASFVKAGIAPERLRISEIQVVDLPLIELPRYKYEINVDENKTE